jgi:hypothetical protein
MIYRNFRYLVAWAVFLLLGILIFQFLHECGHGFGAKLGGYQVSTGFDKVGGVGKRPSDPDFRLNKIIQGRWNPADFLGPLINWLFAVIFTAIFLQQRTANRVALLFAAGAAINALMRLFPMLVFFVSALFGRFILEDEAALGLSAIRGLKFPISYLDFKTFASTHSSLLLAAAKVYFWPAISLIISTVCFVLTYRRLNQLVRQTMISRITQRIFLFMPFLAWSLEFNVLKILDDLIRLNW